MFSIDLHSTKSVDLNRGTAKVGLWSRFWYVYYGCVHVVEERVMDMVLILKANCKY